MRQSSFISKALILTTILTTAALPALAEDKTSITIYSKMGPGAVQPYLYRPTIGGYDLGNYNQIPGYATVRQEREVEIKDKRAEVRLDDIAAFIDPTTVAFKSLTDPQGTTVLEQNYMFDLVSPQKLSERYLGETIQFEKTLTQTTAPEVQSGKLVSVQNGVLTVQKEDGSIITTYPQNAIFPKLPGELFIKPTLVWDVTTTKPGKHQIEAAYQTEGITWWSDYNATFEDGKDANSGFLDLGAWVSIVNRSGAGYPDAKLKLVAGEVNRVEPPMQRNYAMKAMAMDAVAESAGAPGFAEKSFFEYHLYTLGRPTSIPDNSTKQIELFPKATHIPVEKELVYNGALMPFYGGINNNPDNGDRGSKNVDVFLKFKNDKQHGLGIPLPAGRLRVNQLDTADGSLEFIGEDTIQHTPKDEDMRIKMGSAFDVVGERKQTEFFVDHQRQYMDESFEIKIRNHKNSDVKVRVNETLYRAANWQITTSSHEYKKDDSNNVHFQVSVPKDGESVVTYKVHYTW